MSLNSRATGPSRKVQGMNCRVGSKSGWIPSDWHKKQPKSIEVVVLKQWYQGPLRGFGSFIPFLETPPNLLARLQVFIWGHSVALCDTSPIATHKLVISDEQGGSTKSQEHTTAHQECHFLPGDYPILANGQLLAKSLLCLQHLFQKNHPELLS